MYDTEGAQWWGKDEKHGGRSLFYPQDFIKLDLWF